jgi:dihydroxyacid dehydratase/phosphogluconate dehydratase
LTREAIINAIRVNAAIGGSTNAVIHLKAIATGAPPTKSVPVSASRTTAT